MRDKDELLEEYDLSCNEEVNLDFRILFLVYLSILLALVLTLPKIYIRNEIYYLSRDINKLSSEVSVLQAENKNLTQQLESLRFKYQILDVLNME